MPTTKRRINLSIPDVIYEQLQAYKERTGVLNDATACLQLITQQLKSLEQSELMLKLMRETPAEKLIQLSTKGMEDLKGILDQQKPQ